MYMAENTRMSSLVMFISAAVPVSLGLALCIYAYRFSVKLVLRVERVTVERAKECGGDIEFPLQREKLMGILKHQVLYEDIKTTLL